jgi:hypothetical protein
MPDPSRQKEQFFFAFEIDENGKIQDIRIGNSEFLHRFLWEEVMRIVEVYPHK